MSATQTAQAPAIHENSTAVKERRLRTSMNFTSKIVTKHASMSCTHVSTDGALVYSSRDYSPLVVRGRPCLIESFLSIGAIEKTHWTHAGGRPTIPSE